MQTSQGSELSDERTLLDPPEQVGGRVHGNLILDEVDPDLDQQQPKDLDAMDLEKVDVAHPFIKTTETSDTDMLSDEDGASTPPVSPGESAPGGRGAWQLLDGGNNEDGLEKGGAGSDTMSIISSEKSLDEFSFGSEAESQEEDPKIGQILQTQTAPKTFDMDLLLTYIKNGEDVLGDIEGQDVVVVVGNTGTGKSTLIQGIAGKSFHESYHETLKFSQNATKKVFEAGDPLVGFEIGHSKSSMTKSINCFVRKTEAGSKMVYVDTPGFEDTEGPEVDIATSVMLNQIAMKSRSMRFIVMVNYHSLLDDRGGSIRSVLKFIRKFASGSFKDDQKSFIFLFTHTNEIMDCPEDNAGAKRHLLNEIIRTIDGTHDEEVGEVLKFLRICLQKGYPFVDVVDPLTTDFGVLASFAEGKKMKPLKNKRVAAFCGLTSAAQMKLGMHVLELVDELSALLKSGDVDLTRLTEIQDAFRCFEKHLNFGDIHRSIAVYKDIVETNIAKLQLVVDKEVERGTCSSTDDSFSEVNIASLKESIRVLCVLSDDFSIQAISDRIVRKVVDFHTTNFVESCIEYDDVSFKLDKLRAWCNFAPPKLINLYDDAIARVSASVETLRESVEAFDVLGFQYEDDSGALFDFFKQLSHLKTLVDSNKRLSQHRLNASAVVSLISAKLEQWKKVLFDWKALVETYNWASINFGAKSTVESIRAQATALEALSLILSNDFCEPTHQRLVDHIADELSARIANAFEDACVRVLKNFNELFTDEVPRGIDLVDTYSKRLSVLSHVNDELSSAFQGNTWKRIQFVFLSLLNDISNVLKRRVGECEEMARAAVVHGLQSGQRDASFLLPFEKCKWFDSYLPQERKFVGNSASAVIAKYEYLGSTLMNRVRTSLQDHEGDIADGASVRANKLAKINQCCARLVSWLLSELGLGRRASPT